jgi:hypothetical protein
MVPSAKRVSVGGNRETLAETAADEAVNVRGEFLKWKVVRSSAALRLSPVRLAKNALSNGSVSTIPVNDNAARFRGRDRSAHRNVMQTLARLGPLVLEVLSGVEECRDN